MEIWMIGIERALEAWLPAANGGERHAAARQARRDSEMAAGPIRGALRMLGVGAGLSLLVAATATQAVAQVPLYDNLGTHSYRVTTAVPQAQRYFDQGLRLYYAFNHAEAIRAFEEGARIDPSCAMCYWGAALALGPNINAPMAPEAEAEAHVLAGKALAAAGGATASERALMEALARRYRALPEGDRGALDQAFARDMGEIAARFPGDHEIATLHAEALMDLSPWDYWSPAGEPHARTPVILAELERVIAANPNHPGACHFYIHAVEAVAPEQAVACADRLAHLMPGAGHLVHMPAHIYIRVGRWADAIHANEHAVHADETYIRDQNPGMGLYTAGYYPHNFHFLAFAATMAGQSRLAIESAEQVVTHIAPEVAMMAPDLEPLPGYLHAALTTFGRWEEVLATPLPPAEIPAASALAHYARGVAHAATDRMGEARSALETVREMAAEAGERPTAPVLAIAALALEGEIAHRSGDLAAAESAFRRAMTIEDGMMYMEPPLWFYPIRHSLGAVLLDQGRAAEAEEVYRQDLARFPENGWSLIGLQRSLAGQGRTAEANAVGQRLATVWKDADVRPAKSRF